MGILTELFARGTREDGKTIDFLLDVDKTEQMSQESEPSGHWITIGGHKGEGSSGDHGGVAVFIGRNGKILKGPVSLKGENIKRLGDKDSKESRESRAAHAAAHGKTGRDLTEQEARAFGSKAHVEAHAHAKAHARASGVSTHDVLQNMPAAHKFLAEQHQMRETAKERARQMTGMHAGRLAQIENSHRDYSSVPGFDTAARTVAMEHPELGLDPESDETAPAIWELIREGRIHPPQLHHPEVAQQAAEWVSQAKRSHTAVQSDHNPEDDDSFDFGFGSHDSQFVDFSQQ